MTLFERMEKLCSILRAKNRSCEAKELKKKVSKSKTAEEAEKIINEYDRKIV